MTAGSSASPDGKVAGEASQGVTFLDRSRLGRLESLVLVSMFGEVQREDVGTFGSGYYLPATFKRKATVSLRPRRGLEPGDRADLGERAACAGRELPAASGGVNAQDHGHPL